MIIYSITYAVEDGITEEWINFMKKVHIPKILSSGLANQHNFTKVLSESTRDAAFNLQLHYPSKQHLEQYMAELDQQIQAELHQKYTGKLGSFCTFLEKL